MVVTDSDQTSIPKSTSERPPVSTNVASNFSLDSPLLPQYQVVPPPIPPMYPLTSSKPARERACRRFTKAFVFALVIYMLLAMLIRSIMVLAGGDFIDGLPSGPREADGRIIRCANQTWDSRAIDFPFPGVPPYTSTDSFEIPVSISHLFIFSRGSYGHGTIKMELSNRSDDKIEVKVITRYHSVDARARANICHLARDEDGEGLGIYTPRWIFPGHPGYDDQITFDITLRFPNVGSPGNSSIINSLETKMGIWSHDITSFDGRVMFKSLSLSASNAYIRANSVSAEFYQLKTKNAPITGFYNVSKSLILETSNAAIKVTLRMENDDGHKATRVEMKTSNAKIESPITLVATSNHSVHLPAAFSVKANTVNSPIALSFPDAPTSPFSLLDIDAWTTNAPASTTLHPTYEGAITLKTSLLFTPSLLRKSDPTDPSGQNRYYNVEIRKVIGGLLKAGSWWGDDPNKDHGKGNVIVTTSNAPNTLEWI